MNILPFLTIHLIRNALLKIVLLIGILIVIIRISVTKRDVKNVIFSRYVFGVRRKTVKLCETYSGAQMERTS